MALESVLLSISLIGGVGDYNGTDNVSGKGALGFSTAALLNDKIKIELSYVQSEYELVSSRCPEPTCTQAKTPIDMLLHQKNLSLEGRYQFLKEKIRPFVGIGLGYVVRNYENRTPNYVTEGTGTRPIGSLPNSRSWSWLLNAGAEAPLSDAFSLTAKLQYVSTMATSYEGDRTKDYLTGTAYNSDRIIEDLGHYLLTVSVNYRF